jgi:uncharacterized protein YjiS (DUF1127 family)
MKEACSDGERRFERSNGQSWIGMLKELSMDTCAPRHSFAAALFQLGRLLHDAALGLHELALYLDARIAARRETANDRRALEQMSERDLRDIGVSRVELRAAGVGWFTDRHDTTSLSRRMGMEVPGY